MTSTLNDSSLSLDQYTNQFFGVGGDWTPDLHSLPLRLSNKRREEYSKIILYIPFHFLFPNEGLELSMNQR